LLNLGPGGSPALAEDRDIERDLPPAEEFETKVVDGLFNEVSPPTLGRRVLSGKEDHPHRQVCRCAQAVAETLEDFLKKAEGDLRQDPGPVPCPGVGGDGPAVGQTADGLKGKGKDLVAAVPRDVGDKANTAGVVFVLGPVEETPSKLWKTCHALIHPKDREVPESRIKM
jgi:hypothetical protein